jgi:pantoate--beta-alanine ligase
MTIPNRRRLCATLAAVRVITSIESMRNVCHELRHAGKSLGFVPTMGALHAGHLSLVQAARSQNAAVAASVFVNPTQFGPNEDLSKYPRDLDRDRELLEKEKVDLLFAPAAEEMYPPGAVTWVNVEGLSERLEGKSRPEHFRGVTTIVSKLFHIIEPDRAYFGQKDAQQAVIIRKMVRELDLGVEIVVCPTVRESDGLALSSRNVYLNPEERKQALVLYRALCRVQALVDQGQRDAAKLREAGLQVFAEEKQVQLDYFEIVEKESLEPVVDVARGALVVVAARVGKTRLIDNLVL